MGVDLSEAANTDALENKAKALYKQLDEVVEREQAQAQAEGKKLVIIVGEEHIDRGSMLAEHMLLKIAQDRGINNLAYEASDRLLGAMRDNYVQQHFNVTNAPEIVADADSKNINIIPADADIQQGLGGSEREAIMVNSIRQMQGDGLAIFGALHLPAMLGEQESLSKDSHVVLLNLANISAEDIKVMQEKKQYGAAAASQILSRMPGVITVDIGDEFERLPKQDVLQYAAIATGQPELPKLLNSQETEEDRLKLGIAHGQLSEQDIRLVVKQLKEMASDRLSERGSPMDTPSSPIGPGIDVSRDEMRSGLPSIPGNSSFFAR